MRKDTATAQSNRTDHARSVLRDRLPHAGGKRWGLCPLCRTPIRGQSAADPEVDAGQPGGGTDEPTIADGKWICGGGQTIGEWGGELNQLDFCLSVCDFWFLIVGWSILNYAGKY